MKTFAIILLTTFIAIGGVSSQSKWPKAIEQITSCNPARHDTVAAFYRHMIDGYADKISVTQGDSIGLYISIKDSALLSGVADTVKIYRFGPNGWEYKATAGTHSLTYHRFHMGPDGQPTDYKYGAQWTKSKSVTIDSAWQSGVYSAQLTAKKNNVTYAGIIPFVVNPSNPGSTSSILWVVPTNTYQAYNAWGGSSLYWSSLPNSIYQTDTVSFDRPWGESWADSGFTGTPLDSLGQFDERESTWVNWMGSHNYTVEYCADTI